MKRRLTATRWVEREPVDDWRQGVPLSKAEELVTYWRDGYDWRRFEKRLNTFPQFTTNIDGLGIHFLHARSPHEDALPMLITHGWPGSIIEFLDAIDPLVDPTQHGGSAADAFHLVIPSLPGYGFSDRPTEPGWNHERTAAAWGTLMTGLGYTKWVAQGGDWGSLITHTMARGGVEGLIAMQAWPPGRSILTFGRIDLPMAGGHFAAFEQPALFTTEVRNAFRALR